MGKKLIFKKLLRRVFWVGDFDKLIKQFYIKSLIRFASQNIYLSSLVKIFNLITADFQTEAKLWELNHPKSPLPCQPRAGILQLCGRSV